MLSRRALPAAAAATLPAGPLGLAWARLAAGMPGRTPKLLAALVALSLIVAIADFIVPPTREDALVDRLALGGQVDAAHRAALRAQVGQARAAFGLTSALPIASLLLTLWAVLRQARALDAARRQSEALSAELAVALARAEAGARAKSTFLATMSHDIRAPMNGVLGAASLLAHTKLTDMQRRSVEIVTACGEALLTQLDDVLDFSALEADAVALHPEPVDIRALVAATARVVEGAAAQKRLDLAIAVDPDVPETIVVDGRRLRQVLLNLLTNAVKFAAAGGVVLRLSWRPRPCGAWLRAAAIDSGPGVPRADRQRIFAEFARLERAAEREARGTGLGLAIARRIARAMGGTLAAAAARGGGSVFVLRIPVVPAASGAVAVPTGSLRPPPVVCPASAPLRLLVADDDPIDREIAANLLRHLGHRVAVAGDGADALAMARAQPFDCILLGLHMPGHMPGPNGADLATRLRGLPGPVAATWLAAVTADVDAAAHARLRGAGFDAVVAKPVTLERLAAVLPPAPPAPSADEAAQVPGEPTIDTQARAVLAALLAPERFAALVRTFWEEFVRVLERPEGFPGPEADLRLHSLAGSSASLGYLAVAAAARRSRAHVDNEDCLAAPLSDLLAALATTLAADADLLPPTLVARTHAALVAAQPHKAAAEAVR